MPNVEDRDDDSQIEDMLGDLLARVIAGEIETDDGAPCITNCQTFEEAGVLTDNRGLVIEVRGAPSRMQFQICIVRSR